MNLPVIPTPAWLDDAACTQSDPELFFPEPRDTTTANRAKSICAACPVQTECLTAAMEVEAPSGRANGRNSQRHGVYGGLTADERARLARSRYRKEKAA